MKAFIISSLFIVLGVLTAIGCGNNNPVYIEETPKAPDENFFISGRANSRTPRPGIWPQDTTYWRTGAGLYISGDTLTLSGSNSIGFGGGYYGGGGGSNSDESVKIKLVSNTVVGFYSIGGNSQTTLSFSKLFGPRWVTMPGGPVGELHIASYDTAKKIVTGTFRFTGVLTHAFWRTWYTDTLSVNQAWFRALVIHRP